MSVRGEAVFVCCESCAAKVRQNPDAYLAKARAERSAGPLPAATALPLAGQKTCPVTGEPLDHGSAVAVDAGGQTIYVCCQGCAAKVKKDPAPLHRQGAGGAGPLRRTPGVPETGATRQIKNT